MKLSLKILPNITKMELMKMQFHMQTEVHKYKTVKKQQQQPFKWHQTCSYKLKVCVYWNSFWKVVYVYWWGLCLIFGSRFDHEMSTLGRSLGRMFGPQLLPPAAEAEPHAVDFLSSIFIDWLSARDSNLATVDTPRTALLLGFIPFETGIRVAALRADCTSELGWKNEHSTRERISITNTQKIYFSFVNCCRYHCYFEVGITN